MVTLVVVTIRSSVTDDVKSYSSLVSQLAHNIFRTPVFVALGAGGPCQEAYHWGHQVEQDVCYPLDVKCCTVLLDFLVAKFVHAIQGRSGSCIDKQMFSRHATLENGWLCKMHGSIEVWISHRLHVGTTLKMKNTFDAHVHGFAYVLEHLSS